MTLTLIHGWHTQQFGFCAGIRPRTGGRQNIHETAQEIQTAGEMHSQNTCT